VSSLATTAASADPDPLVLRLLLTQYRATGREELFDPLGAALARALDAATAADDPPARAQWLMTLADAASISDDDRLLDAIRTLLTWLSASRAPAAIDASLRGALAIAATDRVASIVDNLEHAIAHAYEPGEGVVFDRHLGFRPDDQVATASALLTAYDVTGRLPYSMLAEELMQTLRLREPDDEEVGRASQTVSVLCRLASLHRDDGYRSAAVVARDADYRTEAERLIARHETRIFDDRRDRAAFALALAQWLELQ